MRVVFGPAQGIIQLGWTECMASIEEAVINVDVHLSLEQYNGMLNGFVSFTTDEQQLTLSLQCSWTIWKLNCLLKASEAACSFRYLDVALHVNQQHLVVSLHLTHAVHLPKLSIAVDICYCSLLSQFSLLGLLAYIWIVPPFVNSAFMYTACTAFSKHFSHNSISWLLLPCNCWSILLAFIARMLDSKLSHKIGI